MTTLEKLLAKGACAQLGGILDIIYRGYASPDEIDALKKLKRIDFVIAGRRICDYVAALLDFLGVEKYTGDHPHVTYLIRDMKSLYPPK